MEQFQQDIQVLKELSIAEVEQLTKGSEQFVLFVGRGTCPYCRRFAPKFANVVRDNGLTGYFLNSEKSADLAAIQAYREQHGIKTVPGLVVAQAGQVRVVCDSSLSEAAILNFIQGV